MLDRLKLQYTNSVLYAPSSGTIHGFEGYAPGAIIKPGETLFSIIPQGAKFYVQINIPANTGIGISFAYAPAPRRIISKVTP